MHEFRAQMKQGGRVIIPAPLRKLLKIKEGEELVLKLEEDGLHIMPLSRVLKQAQSLTQKYNKTGKKLTDSLYALRQEEND